MALPRKAASGSNESPGKGMPQGRASPACAPSPEQAKGRGTPHSYTLALLWSIHYNQPVPKA